MASIQERAIAHGEEILSSAVHKTIWVPGIESAARRATGLTRPNDLLLRWRVGTAIGSRDDWEKIPGNPDASPRDLNTWKSGIIAAERQDMDDARASGGRPAVAYRMGSLVMVGVREREPYKGNFLFPMDASGALDPDGPLIGVAERTGPHPNNIVLGTTSTNGREIVTLPTRFIEAPNGIPEGLLRI